jgi:hypothetical protein
VDYWDEEHSRRIFASTSFDPAGLRFKYEPLRANIFAVTACRYLQRFKSHLIALGWALLRSQSQANPYIRGFLPWQSELCWD